MYDYIVIGAGSAGCVLTNKLSENPDNKVLLLEAGGPDDIQEIYIPAAFGGLFKTPIDWDYATAAEENMNGRELYWPRGKVLGGSSSINAMIYIRGHRNIYDAWAKMGNEGWEYDDVLPAFKEVENQERGADDFHGVGGGLNVADQRDPNALTAAFVDAAAAVGIARNPDFNGAEQIGSGYYQVTQKNGQRCSASAAFLHPVMNRENLTIQTNAQVQKLMFEGNRCVGVTYLHEGKEVGVRVNKEIILSAGSIGSPQILMLSGVGPREHLEEMGINVVVDLPGVGQNLQDHPAVMVAYHCNEPITLANAETEESVETYTNSGKGPLSSNVGEGGAFLQLDESSIAPDMQYHFAPSWFVEHGFKNPEGHGYTIGPTLLLPESRGQIKLRSANPADRPVIEANYFSAEKDMRLMIEGVKLARKMGESDMFKPYNGGEYLPGPDVQTDEQIADFISQYAETLYHPVGTCKMGVDEMAVVNPELQVHGVEGLRVADASVMPIITNGNTNAPTIMIGTKCAQMILG